MLYGNWFGNAIHIDLSAHPAMATMAKEFHGIFGMMAHGVTTVPFWLAVSGAATAWYLYIARPDLPAVIRAKMALPVRVLENKYGFDDFNQWFFANGACGVGRGLWKVGDQTIIDGMAVNGSAKLVGWFAGVVRLIQSGHLYQYAFSMIIGVFVLLTLWVNRA